MFLLKSLIGISGHDVAGQRRARTLAPGQRRPGPLLLERLENRLCLSTRSERVIKRHLLLATLVAIVMTAFIPCADADLFVGSSGNNSVLRYSEVTGDFIDAFVDSGIGELSGPKGLILGHDGNLYVNSSANNTVLRYDGTTGAPLPAPGQTGATFVPMGSGGLQGPAGLILGPDGNLYVVSQTNNSVHRYSGTTGDFIDAFVPAGSGGLQVPRGLVFGPDANLYVNNDGSVMRYDGTTGAPLPAPGKMGAVFASGLAQLQVGLVFGPDGNLYVANYDQNSVMRFNGATGKFMDTFVSPGRGGLNSPNGLIFGPDNNVYLSSFDSNRVLRFDGTTGAFIDEFITRGSGGLNGSIFLFFTNTDPTTLAYVPAPANRFLITAPATAVSGTPFDVTLTTLDRSGNIATGYSGTVTFASSDPQASLPANYTFTAADNGLQRHRDLCQFRSAGHPAGRLHLHCRR